VPTNEQRRQAAKRKLERQRTRRAERAKRRRWYAVIGSAAAVMLVVGLVVLITVLGGDDGADRAAAPPGEQPVPSSEVAAALRAPVPTRSQPLPATVNCRYPDTGRAPAGPVQPPPAGPTSTKGTVDLTLQTSAGAIPLTLDRGLAPCTVNSFLSLAEQGYYDNTPCHRLTTGPALQVLQCGDPTGSGRGGPGYTVPDEVFPELSYGRGLLAMANTGQPDSGGSQFFMIYGDAQLPPEYTVFGTIAPAGLRVLDEVAGAGVKGGGSDGAPKTPVRITNVTVKG
jgi:peptidyl-prolyl cis-trans isomerase B (cyclophilin B)